MTEQRRPAGPGPATQALATVAPAPATELARRVFGGDERVLALMDLIGARLSAAQLEVFASVCEQRGLDPFKREIYAQLRNTKVGDHWEPKLVIMVGIDGLRVLAARTGQYMGQIGPQWCGPDGQWTDVWLKAGAPAAARVGIYHRGFREPLWSVARYESYVQTAPRYAEGKVVGSGPNDQWTRQPDHMLAKCAEADALRRAFPEGSAGLAVLVDPGESSPRQAEQVRQRGKAVARQYDAIFGADELDNPTRITTAGRVVDGSTGEVLDEEPSDVQASLILDPLPSREALWAENRRLVARARELGLTSSIPTLAVQSTGDVIAEANGVLAERIHNLELDQRLAAAEGAGESR